MYVCVIVCARVCGKISCVRASYFLIVEHVDLTLNTCVWYCALIRSTGQNHAGICTASKGLTHSS
jgi:hypothetical protein